MRQPGDLPLMWWVIGSVFVWSTVVWASDTPQALVRKSDGATVGVGYSDFEGVESLASYEVRPLTSADYQQALVALDASERNAAKQRERDRKTKEQAMRTKLELTPQEFDDLKDALR